MVAMEAGCSPAEVVAGRARRAPRGLVVPWSEASIGGYALERVLSARCSWRGSRRARRSLWPPGPYALGLAAADAVEAIVTTSRRALSVLTVLDGEFGVRNRVGSMPALLDGAASRAVRVPSLNTRERVQVETALGA